MRFLDSILAGIVLNREAIQSDNFVSGISGWRVRKIGDAEFNNVVIRGGTVVSGLALYYNGTPALGNLIFSISATAGTDSFGNAYLVGVTSYSSDGTINLNGNMLSCLSTSGSEIDITCAGGSAAIDYTPPSVGGVTWNSGSVGTTKDATLGANTPQVFIVSPYASPNTARSQIQLYGSSPSTNDNLIRLVANNTQVLGDLLNSNTDLGRGVQAFTTVTANVALGTAGTEFALMTLPSMTFVNGRAYRVDLWGLQQSTTTADTYFLHQFRKGTGTAGTLYKGQMRVRTLNATSTNNSVGLSFYLENTSGADITTTTTWTASCAAGTGGIFAASAGNQASATIIDVGLASQFPGQGVS